MEIACAECGTAFEAKRASARFCSTSCRVRAHRKKGPKLPQDVKTALAERSRAADDAGDEVVTGRILEEPDEDAVEGVAHAVRKELHGAGVLYTTRGQSAMVLAQRLDMPVLDTGSAVAALVKQLEATLAAALAGQVEEVDELEELRRRREERLGTG